MQRLSSAEEYYSTYSEPVYSDDDSEGGYETAAAAAEEGASARGSLVALEVEGPPKPAYVASAPSEGTHFQQIVRTLAALNDCIWCTNVFTSERLKGRNMYTFFGTRKLPQILYPDEDIKKELEYIEFLLHALLKLLLPLFGEVDDAPSDEEDLFHKMSFLLSRCSSHASSLASAELSNGDAVPQRRRRGSPRCFDERELATMLRTIAAEVEATDSDPTEARTRDVRKAGEALRSLRGLFEEEEGARAAAAEVRSVLCLEHGFEWDEDLRRLAARVNCAAGLANYFVGRVRESTAAGGDWLRSGEVRRTLPTVGHWEDPAIELMFARERWRVWAVRRSGGDPADHLCGIALPLDYASFKSDTRATYYGIKRKNMLSIALQTADMSEKVHKSLPKKVFDLGMLLLSTVLYLSDLISDLILAGDHYSQGNKWYSGLTLLFVFAPFVSETLSKLILKALAWDKEYGELQWRDVFNFNDFKIIKWMACSVNYSVRSMLDYGHLAPQYAVLHSHRRAKGRREGCGGDEDAGDGEHIHRVFYSMLAWNERFTLQTKLAESLNESAPQLLLQLVIVFRQMASRNPIGFKTWFCIVTSTLSLSWSMHLSHFNRHYHTGGRILNNSYLWKARILEFIGNCFVYGSRLVSIALVASIFGAWFVLGAFPYLVAVYLVMILASGRKEIYKTLHRYKTTIFWPIHRLFTVPYRIGVWRMDSIDHLLYYAEVVALALLPAALAGIPTSSPDAEPSAAAAAWITAGALLFSVGLGVALLYAFKRCVHPYGYVCENR